MMRAMIQRGGSRYRKPCYSIACPVCGTIFHPRPFEVKKGHGKWCSRECADIGRRETEEERFWKNVQKTNECWLWTGLKNRQGYGKTWTSGKGAITKAAHRVSWEIHYGPIPPGKFVCHHCDNTSCVRPDHLFLGNAQANMDDKINKGRQGNCGPTNPIRGSNHHHAKLTERQIVEIRTQYKSGKISQQQLGDTYGIHQSAISSIILKKGWKHI